MKPIGPQVERLYLGLESDVDLGDCEPETEEGRLAESFRKLRLEV